MLKICFHLEFFFSFCGRKYFKLQSRLKNFFCSSAHKEPIINVSNIKKNHGYTHVALHKLSYDTCAKTDRQTDRCIHKNILL